MATVPYEPSGVAEVHIVLSYSDYTTLTTAEINAGTRATGYITDGPPSPSGASFLDSGTLLSKVASQVASTSGGGSGTMTVRKIRDTTTTDDTADTVYNLLPTGTVGVFAVFPYGAGGASGAAAVGDTIDAIPFEVGNRQPILSKGALAVGQIELAFNDTVVQNYDLAS